VTAQELHARPESKARSNRRGWRNAFRMGQAAPDAETNWRHGVGGGADTSQRAGRGWRCTLSLPASQMSSTRWYPTRAVLVAAASALALPNGSRSRGSARPRNGALPLERSFVAPNAPVPRHVRTGVTPRSRSPARAARSCAGCEPRGSAFALQTAPGIDALTEISDNVTVATELAASGDGTEAEQLLAIQVTRLLRHAGRGGHVPEELRERVCGLALELAQRTASVPWLDWVIELHLITDAPLSPRLLAALESARALLNRVDEELLTQYLETMQQRHRSLSDADLEVVSHLRELSGARDG